MEVHGGGGGGVCVSVDFVYHYELACEKHRSTRLWAFLSFTMSFSEGLFQRIHLIHWYRRYAFICRYACHAFLPTPRDRPPLTLTQQRAPPTHPPPRPTLLPTSHPRSSIRQDRRPTAPLPKTHLRHRRPRQLRYSLRPLSAGGSASSQMASATRWSRRVVVADMLAHSAYWAGCRGSVPAWEVVAV